MNIGKFILCITFFFPAIMPVKAASEIAFVWRGSTTKAKTFEIWAESGETITVDWGDGTTGNYTGKGINFDEEHKVTASHYYNIESFRKVLITGNVVKFRCHRQVMTTLNVTRNELLTSLDCSYNKLKNIDLNKNTMLNNLNCSKNLLLTLDVSKNLKLKVLNCFDNKRIKNLNVGNNTELTYLNCYKIGLSNLDVSSNTALETLICHTNNITKLKIGYNTTLRLLNCKKNSLSAMELNRIFESLPLLSVAEDAGLSIAKKEGNTVSNPSPSVGEIIITSNPGGNSCSKQIAEKKGWKFLYN